MRSSNLKKEKSLQGEMNMIEFREIDRHNFDDVIDLKVADEQKSFVATNLYSLAQAKAYPECICLAYTMGMCR